MAHTTCVVFACSALAQQIIGNSLVSLHMSSTLFYSGIRLAGVQIMMVQYSCLRKEKVGEFHPNPVFSGGSGVSERDHQRARDPWQ